MLFFLPAWVWLRLRQRLCGSVYVNISCCAQWIGFDILISLFCCLSSRVYKIYIYLNWWYKFYKITILGESVICGDINMWWFAQCYMIQLIRLLSTDLKMKSTIGNVTIFPCINHDKICTMHTVFWCHAKWTYKIH